MLNSSITTFSSTCADNIICNEKYIKLEKGKIVFLLVSSTIYTFSENIRPFNKYIQYI